MKIILLLFFVSICSIENVAANESVFERTTEADDFNYRSITIEVHKELGQLGYVRIRNIALKDAIQMLAISCKRKVDVSMLPDTEVNFEANISSFETLVEMLVNDHGFTLAFKEHGVYTFYNKL